MNFIAITINWNVKNENNVNFTFFNATNNPNLTCIEIDDPAHSDFYWQGVDPQSTFSSYCKNNCTTELNETDNLSIDKEVIDLLGSEVLPKPNEVLIYRYSDGTS